MLGFGTADDVSNIARADDQTGILPADFPYVRREFQAPISGEKKFYRVRAVPQGVGDQLTRAAAPREWDDTEVIPPRFSKGAIAPLPER
jgi:hypothetical protein